MIRTRALAAIDAASYRRHALHGEGADWPEKNCYADLWIAFLHALGQEPRAMLPFTVAADFEGDQWTFFKPPLSELRKLYGIDVQEMTVWRPLLDHAEEHLAAGKLISTEADAFWLPDTSGTDYREKHTKTTILIASVDREARRLGYFHNAGYFELEGEDFVRLFRLDMPDDPGFMPFFAELVRTDRMRRRSEGELAQLSHGLLREHVAWRPASNPFTRFAARVAEDMPHWHSQGMERYHAWAFAAIRQAGAAFELAGACVRWLGGHGHPGLLPAADCFEAISRANKSLILKGARAAHTGRPLDIAAYAGETERAWQDGMQLLEESVRRG